MSVHELAGKDGYAPRRVDKPWGYELVWAETDRYAGKILHIKKGHALSLQYHEAKIETIMPVSGRIEVVYFEAGDEDGPKQHIILEPFRCFHVRPGLRHRFMAIEDADVFEVSTPELDDVVRLADLYGRVES